MFFEPFFECIAARFCSELFRERVPDCQVLGRKVARLMCWLLRLGVLVGVGVGDVVVAL